MMINNSSFAKGSQGEERVARLPPADGMLNNIGAKVQGMAEAAADKLSGAFHATKDTLVGDNDTMQSGRNDTMQFGHDLSSQPGFHSEYKTNE
ncbi:unnamed protein product, partial [Strongylus vulgaris]